MKQAINGHTTQVAKSPFSIPNSFVSYFASSEKTAPDVGHSRTMFNYYSTSMRPILARWLLQNKRGVAEMIRGSAVQAVFITIPYREETNKQMAPSLTIEKDRKRYRRTSISAQLKAQIAAYLASSWMLS